ncbi:hypothetical protein HKD37_18G050343 [Glycine soja]|nr:hypothetical protein GmHk_18G051472 [Glycine max]
MDIAEDAEIPLILGRPFMLTTKCVVDIGKCNLEMSVEDQKATFNLFKAIEHPSDNKTCFKVEKIEQKVNLVERHLNSVFLEEDEAKPVVNPTNSSSVFLRPKQVRARATLDIPLVVLPPSVSPPPTGQTSPPFCQLKQLLPMLHSLHHGQYLLMQSLHHLSLQQPMMTLEIFLAQVVWPRGQCPSVRGGDTFGVVDDDAADVEADDDYVADISDAHKAWDPGPTQD